MAKKNGSTTPPVVFALDANEAKLIRDYRATSDRHQASIVLGMAGVAKAFPRHTTPSLRLIVGGAA